MQQSLMIGLQHWVQRELLPDVLWIMDNNLYVRNGWVTDLTPFLEKDPTFDEGLFWGVIH